MHGACMLSVTTQTLIRFAKPSRESMYNTDGVFGVVDVAVVGRGIIVNIIIIVVVITVVVVVDVAMLNT